MNHNDPEISVKLEESKEAESIAVRRSLAFGMIAGSAGTIAIQSFASGNEVSGYAATIATAVFTFLGMIGTATAASNGRAVGRLQEKQENEIIFPPKPPLSEFTE